MTEQSPRTNKTHKVRFAFHHRMVSWGSNPDKVGLKIKAGGNKGGFVLAKSTPTMGKVLFIAALPERLQIRCIKP